MVFLFGGIILWIGFSRSDISTSGENPLPKIGSPVPSFELPDVDGRMISSKEYLGTPLIINFWATRCAPCKLEMPLLQKTAKKFDNNLTVFAVNFDEPEETVIKYVRQNSIDIPVVLDESGAMANSYGVHAFPVTFFIDKGGILRSTHIGQLDGVLIQSYLKTIGITE